MLWELCTRELPVRGQIRDIRIPQEAPQLVADLIRQCLDVDPAKRPTMEQLIHKLMVGGVESGGCLLASLGACLALVSVGLPAC